MIRRDDISQSGAAVAAYPSGIDRPGVALESALRPPLSAQSEDFAQAQRIIALSRQEHAPMVTERFPTYASIIEYWEVGDLPWTLPAEAVACMTETVQDLVAALRS
ncbi:MAG: hypothetical protein KDJ28_15530 [Candidatus Competibacteraceae bacterium]|nr:hypothetical protein [Candidatus Competibacteraceae bacterium]